MKNIILTTLNSRYSHSSLGLRYLIANLKELKPQTEILEFVINSSIQTIAEQILEKKPKIIGIAVYIWNAFDVGELVKIIKKVVGKFSDEGLSGTDILGSLSEVFRINLILGENKLLQTILFILRLIKNFRKI